MREKVSRTWEFLSRWEGIACLIVLFGLGSAIWSRLVHGPWEPTSRWWLTTGCQCATWIFYLHRGAAWYHTRYGPTRQVEQRKG